METINTAQKQANRCRSRFSNDAARVRTGKERNGNGGRNQCHLLQRERVGRATSLLSSHIEGKQTVHWTTCPSIEDDLLGSLCNTHPSDSLPFNRSFRDLVGTVFHHMTGCRCQGDSIAFFLFPSEWFANARVYVQYTIGETFWRCHRVRLPVFDWRSIET